MIQIERSYHFYAAHRNPEAGEKCGRIHGHTYKVIVTLEMKLNASGITMLFDDIDRTVAPIVRKFDHFFIVWKEDRIGEILRDESEPIYTVDFPTSAENLAIHFFDSIKYEGLPIVKLQLKETESSNIIITN